MKYHKLDWILVALLGAQLFLLVLPFFVEMSALSLFFLVLLNIFLMGTNYQCIAHNFIHLPFFKSKSLNSTFSIFNTFGLGVPQSMYKMHHLHHHRYNNQPEHDISSTFRFGKNGKEENIFTYSLFGIMRTDLVDLFKQGSRNSNLPAIESVVFILVLALSAFVNWKLFAIYVLSTYFGGQFFALWENYCEHHYANPHDRKRDSVSCYNGLYNFLWFNNGYHQEHHFSPQVHWTEIPKMKASLPDDRVIVKGCHLTNSF